MPVYQVEEYYIHMQISCNEQQKAAIEGYLSDEGYMNYEFQENDTVLVVDDIPSEAEGDDLEDAINNLL